MTYEIDKDPILTKIFAHKTENANCKSSISNPKEYLSNFVKHLSDLISIDKAHHTKISVSDVNNLFFKTNSDAYSLNNLYSLYSRHSSNLKQNDPKSYYTASLIHSGFYRTFLKQNKNIYENNYTLLIPADFNRDPTNSDDDRLTYPKKLDLRSKFHSDNIKNILDYLELNNYDHQLEFSNTSNYSGYKLSVNLDNFYDPKTNKKIDLKKSSKNSTDFSNNLKSILDHIVDNIQLDVSNSKHIYLPDYKGISITKTHQNSSIFNYISDLEITLKDFMNDPNFEKKLYDLNDNYVDLINSNSDLSGVEDKFQDLFYDFLDVCLDDVSTEKKDLESKLGSNYIQDLNKVLDNFESIVSNNVSNEYAALKCNLNLYLSDYLLGNRSSKDLGIMNNIMSTLFKYINEYTNSSQKFTNTSEYSEFKGGFNIQTPMYKNHKSILTEFKDISQNIINYQESINICINQINSLNSIYDSMRSVLPSSKDRLNTIDPTAFSDDEKTVVMNNNLISDYVLDTINILDPDSELTLIDLTSKVPHPIYNVVQGLSNMLYDSHFIEISSEKPVILNIKPIINLSSNLPVPSKIPPSKLVDSSLALSTGS